MKECLNGNAHTTTTPAPDDPDKPGPIGNLSPQIPNSKGTSLTGLLSAHEMAAFNTHNAHATDTNADREENWAGETFWGAQGKTRTDYVAGPRDWTSQIQPVVSDVRAGHALKNANVSGMWDDAPMIFTF